MPGNLSVFLGCFSSFTVWDVLYVLYGKQKPAIDDSDFVAISPRQRLSLLVGSAIRGVGQMALVICPL